MIKTTAGPLTVTFVNHGAQEHTFKIEGTSMLLKANGGKTTTGTVTLAKGTYNFECTDSRARAARHEGHGRRLMSAVSDRAG